MISLKGLTKWKQNEEWYDFDESGVVYIKDSAPEDIKENFALYEKKMKEISEREKETGTKIL